MQCRGALRTPLRNIIKNIGFHNKSSPHPPTGHVHVSAPRVRHPATPDAPPLSHQAYSTSGATAHRRTEHGGSESDSPEQARRTDYTPDPSVVSKRQPQSHLGRATHSDHPQSSLLNNGGPSETDLRPRITQALGHPADWEPPKKYFKIVESKTRYRAQKAHIRKERQRNRRNHVGSLVWRDILRTLERSTPYGTHRYRKSFETVSLPDGVSAIFRGNAGATVLEIMQRSGSHIQAVPKESGVFSEVVLHGTVAENTVAMQILPEYVRVGSDINLSASQNLADYSLKRETKKKQEFDFQSASSIGSDHAYSKLFSEEDADTHLESSITELTATPLRSTWHVDRYRQRPTREQLQQRPKITSALGLSRYVNDLLIVTPRPARSRQKFFVNHISYITHTLVGLFEEQNTIKLATNETVDRALRFLTKHGKFPEVRKIGELLEINGYTFSASNYDVLLDAAAKVTDLPNFRHLLRTMLQNDLQPTPVTWARFHSLMTRQHPDHAGIVIEAMRRKGLLANDAALVQVIHDAVELDLEPLIRTGGTLSHFLRLSDLRLQSVLDRPDFNWLSRDVMNRVAHVFLKAGRSADAYEILAEYKRRNRQAYIDAGTLGIFLTPAVRTSNATKLAVEVLNHFQVGRPGAVVLTPIVYAMLLHIAFRDCGFNMLRVVWRYACAAGYTSAESRKRIMASMLQYSPPEPTRNGFMRCWGGKFAVGVSDGLRHGKMQPHDELTAVKSEDEVLGSKGKTSESPSAENLSPHEQIMLELGHETELAQDSPRSAARRQKLRSVFQSDLHEVEQSSPFRPLADMVTEAYERDLAWRKLDIGLSRGLAKWTANEMFAYMIRDGVQVPMRPGNFATHTFTSEIPWQLEQARGPNRREETQRKEVDNA